MRQERLDELVAALASTRPRMDDIARARVAAVVLQAARAGVEPAPRSSHRRRWAIGVATAAAVVVVGLIVRGTGGRVPPGVRSPAVAELPEDAVVSAAQGATLHGQLDGAALTLYGPGWVIRHGRRIVVESDALVIDRSAGDQPVEDPSVRDQPVELQIRSATIRMQYAAFSVSGTNALQVTVLRGEIWLTCAGSQVEQPVMAGRAATCGAERTAAGRPAPSPSGLAPSPGAPAAAVPAATIDAPSPAPGRTDEPAPSPSPASAVAPKRPATTDRGGSRHSFAATADASPAEVPAAAPRLAPPVATTVPALPALVPLIRIAHGSAPTGPPPGPEPVPLSTWPEPPPDPASRYVAAERLMATDPAAARAALRTLVADAPTAPEAAPAWLDLARLAIAAGDHVAARVALDQLARSPGAAELAMPAAYLRCGLEQTDPGRRTCLAGFRAAFPGSPRDAEALARLAAATAQAGDCRTALPLLLEYQQRHPDGPDAGAMRAWQVRCQPAAEPQSP